MLMCVLTTHKHKLGFHLFFFTRHVKKDRTFAIKTLLLILQHFKHCPLQSSPRYWRYTVPNISSIVGMLPGMHFL
jgi:hypothetical protein